MKPILFSTQMVQAIIEGRKTQTRRIITPQPSEYCTQFIKVENHFLATHDNDMTCDPGTWKPQYQPGDILYVRETFGKIPYEGVDPKPTYFYKADGGDIVDIKGIWKPSIHMPAAAARLFLKVTAVKAERLQDITEADAIAEGCQSGGDWSSAPTTEFSALWQSIYGPESVNDDPWVWAYTFERCDAPTIHRSQFTVHNSPLK